MTAKKVQKKINEIRSLLLDSIELVTPSIEYKAYALSLLTICDGISTILHLLEKAEKKTNVLY